jgi:hypothetical protein
MHSLQCIREFTHNALVRNCNGLYAPVRSWPVRNLDSGFAEVDLATCAVVVSVVLVGMCAKLPLWQLRGISCHFGNLAHLLF